MDLLWRELSVRRFEFNSKALASHKSLTRQQRDCIRNFFQEIRVQPVWVQICFYRHDRKATIVHCGCNLYCSDLGFTIELITSSDVPVESVLKEMGY
jgi:radical SAM superfamily enzyme